VLMSLMIVGVWRRCVWRKTGSTVSRTGTTTESLRCNEVVRVWLGYAEAEDSYRLQDVLAYARY